jgi:hypothetical protein
MVSHFHEASEDVERAKLLNHRSSDTVILRLGLPSSHASVLMDLTAPLLRPSPSVRLG